MAGNKTGARSVPSSSPSCRLPSTSSALNGLVRKKEHQESSANSKPTDEVTSLKKEVDELKRKNRQLEATNKFLEIDWLEGGRVNQKTENENQDLKLKLGDLQLSKYEIELEKKVVDMEERLSLVEKERTERGWENADLRKSISGFRREEVKWMQVEKGLIHLRAEVDALQEQKKELKSQVEGQRKMLEEKDDKISDLKAECDKHITQEEYDEIKEMMLEGKKEKLELENTNKRYIKYISDERIREKKDRKRKREEEDEFYRLREEKETQESRRRKLREDEERRIENEMHEEVERRRRSVLNNQDLREMEKAEEKEDE